MKHEYHEGLRLGENFEQLARAVFSEAEGCGSQKTAQEENYTPQNDRQRQRLERYLLPRPCLRQVVRVCILAGQLGVCKSLSPYLRHG